ncbi:MAG: hypothetical protein J4203_05450 [Candidatus Diapherotrites archaeon]|uniref:Uncharacterized protein n=2 Tax=Candidatus Iainarchaeum sp. TaxID=3101447 RepID=A0A8T4L7P6_9ARCH|nr:hypothetical protein [Candidatus Diapherotrites archaeon]
MLTFLGFLGEMFADANFVLKIFILLTIVSWARMHLGKSALSYILIAGFCYFVFFSDLWALFGGVYLLYMLFMLGFASIIIDFFFVTQSQGMPQQGQEEQGSPVDSGKDVMERMHGMRHPHPGLGARPRPPPMMPG